MEKKYKVKLNSIEKIEELLQEIYDQAVRHLNEIQMEMNKLQNSTNLGQDGISIEDKAKYAKIAVNYPDYIAYDFMGDKERALKSKFEIAKFMGELAKHGGDLGETLNDQGFVKKTSLDLKALKSSISNDDNGGSSTYILKK